MSDRPTTEEKAAAFDAIVKMLQGKHEWIEDRMEYPKMTPKQMTSPRAANTVRPRCVSTYEWVIRCADETDVEKVLLAAVKR